jgi:murein DD-endopeptidase MepM/ murein hydrolase activator NlpD
MTRYVHITASAGIAVGKLVTAGQQIGTIDASGCQSGRHTHIGRYDPNGVAVNFTVPCSYPTQFSNDDLDDGDPTS